MELKIFEELLELYENNTLYVVKIVLKNSENEWKEIKEFLK